jgi:endo-1,4-beta-xylanase
LFYNEAEGDTLNRKSEAIYAMVRDFRNRGVPIDGVGLQLQLPRLDYDTGAIAANMERLTKLGLQVHITELDVALPVDPQGAPRPEDLQRQADAYPRVVRTCLQNPGCSAIQTWGFTDKYSWIGSHSHGTQGAGLLFDRAYIAQARLRRNAQRTRNRAHADPLMAPRLRVRTRFSASIMTG